MNIPSLRVLDLYCGVGGASAGYVAAGYEVLGVDLQEQPDYPFEFIRADAVEVLADLDFVRTFDLIHASPPCQRDAAITRGTNAHLRDLYPDLYPPTLAGLILAGVAYAIENPAARPDVVLCGTTLGLSVIRHRKFELGHWSMAQPAHVKHAGTTRGWRHGLYRDGRWPDGRVIVEAYGAGGGKATVPEMQAALGIDWTTNRHSLTEAIPPAYTELIGRQFAAQVAVECAA